MSSLLCLFALVAQAAVPTLEALVVENEEGGSIVRIAVSGAPSFTTEEGEGTFVIDFVGVESSLPDLEETDAPGLLGVRHEAREQGHRMRFLLAPGAQAEPQMEEGALVIRITAGAEEDPAEAMAAAMAGLASQVARIGEGVRELSASTGSAEEAEAAEEETELAPMVLADPEEEPGAMDLSEPEPEVEVEPVALAEAEPEPAAEPEPEVVAAPEPEPETPAAVAAPPAVATKAPSGSAELVRLGFRPTPTGAMVFLVVEGLGEPHLDHHADRVIVELPGTRIRRANDKRPLDASFFGTPVKTVRAVEDRASATTRLEIELARPAEVSLQRMGDEIAIALGEVP